MRLAYGDPPYIGQAKRHYLNDPSGIAAKEVDHTELLTMLRDTYDGWALSASSPSLEEIYAIIKEVFPPHKVRQAVWVKPFCSWKPTHRVQYTWEPVLFVPARPNGSRAVPSVRDYLITEPEEMEDVCIANITMKKGTHGAKPDKFNDWILELIGYKPDEDFFIDLFPGTGGMTRAIERKMESGGIKR